MRGADSVRILGYAHSMDDEMKPWEPNVEDATQLAHQTSTAVQTLTRLLERKGLITREEADSVMTAFESE